MLLAPVKHKNILTNINTKATRVVASAPSVCLLLTGAGVQAIIRAMTTDPRAKALYSAIGRRIADARMAKSPRLTQEELANRTAGSVSRSALANMESGRQRVSVHQLYEVAAALGLSPEELLPPSDALPTAAAEALDGSERDHGFIQSVRDAVERKKLFPPKGELGT